MSTAFPVLNRPARRRSTYIPGPVRISAVGVTAIAVTALVGATTAAAAVLPLFV
ncbi:hypothetical protein ACFWZW_12585 [Microbacterium enclense]|uniref:hypothetical protein n=1 Tax=Microbacterium enclense TaxID=993073 RepID=UPI0036DE99D9